MNIPVVGTPVDQRFYNEMAQRVAALEDQIRGMGGTPGLTKKNSIEFDGPQRAYFEVSDGQMDGWPSNEMRIMRFVYRTIGVVGENEGKVRDWLDAALLTLRTWCEENDAMIVWRHRPTIEHRPATYHDRPATEAEMEAGVEPELVHTPAQWKARARFVTTRPMPPEIWAALCVKAEGEEFKRV